MSLRDQYTSASRQQQQEKERKAREAAFAYTPKGKMKRIDDTLSQIAATIEDDLNKRIRDLQAGAGAASPLTYRIENISNMPEKDMKDVQRLEGYKALRRACGKPEIDVRVDVVLHHGCLNNGVDIRVFPDRPFKDSALSIDGFNVRKFPQRFKAAAGARKTAAPQDTIPILKPLTFGPKAGV